MLAANRIPSPVRAARNAAQRLYDTSIGVAELAAGLDRLSTEIVQIRTKLADLEQRVANGHQSLIESLGSNHAETAQILRLLHDDEPANRRRLWRLRESPEYSLAFTEAEPLVSICIATYRNTDLLLERAVPSLLGQTYEHIEVVIVGDAATPDVERRLRAVGDPRLRYANMTMRGPYPEDAEQLWFVAGGPPSNEAMRLARGRWIAGMDDDDASAPDRVALLLEAARGRDLEFCYGQIAYHRPDGSSEELCAFPPELGKVGLQGSLMHADLRFICAELSDAVFRVPGDWSRIRRMMRLGVRMGMIDAVVTHHYPSWLWGRRDG